MDTCLIYPQTHTQQGFALGKTHANTQTNSAKSLAVCQLPSQLALFWRKTMLKLTHIRETELRKLRQLRDEIATAINYDKKERLRQARAQEEIEEYNWKFYTRRTNVTQRRGTGAR
jgi:hypothetical protein